MLYHVFHSYEDKSVIFVLDVNECKSNPCENGGTCTNAVNGYTCKCVPGYTDKTCRTGLSE